MNQWNYCKRIFQSHRYLTNHRSHGCSSNTVFIYINEKKVSNKQKCDDISRKLNFKHGFITLQKYDPTLGMIPSNLLDSKHISPVPNSSYNLGIDWIFENEYSDRMMDDYCT